MTAFFIWVYGALGVMMLAFIAQHSPVLRKNKITQLGHIIFIIGLLLCLLNMHKSLEMVMVALVISTSCWVGSIGYFRKIYFSK